MIPRKTLPLVAICGRPNVGKSTLYNRIIGRQHAIVHYEEGITRDRTYGEAEFEGRRFRIVDTGGVVENPTDPITRKMQEQVRAALQEAAAVIFVVDGQQEITRVDEEVRDELFRLGKPVVLAVNKLDNAKLELNKMEFFSLGLGEPYGISSGHGVGIGDLLEAVIAHLPETEDEEPEPLDDTVIRVAIVGKPNVGKSSFVNAVLNEERTIVDNTPGTTRDAIDIRFHWKGSDYVLIDTAGMRKRGKISEDVEYFTVARSLRAIRRCDVALVMMDATEGITDQDKKIIQYVEEQGRGMVLVWTKWDLVEEKERRIKEIEDEIGLKAPFLSYVPSVTISNLTRQRLFSTFEFIDRVAAETSKRVSTPEMNKFLASIRDNVAAAIHKGKQARVKYATQAGVKPTVIVLFVNSKKLFHFSYMRFLENRFRERFGFEGVPLKFELREEQRDAKGSSKE
ncbi:MAG: GTPase Der [Candidatus Hydrogenedentota bacterium]